MLLERLHRPGRALADRPLEQQPDVLAGQVRVLLGAGERELLLDDLLGQDEPRVVPACPPQVAQGAEGVEAREERRRQPVAAGVEPQRRRPGQDPDAVVLPDRVPVADPLDVVPHPVRVDHVGAGCLGDAEHPAVHVCRYAGDHRPRRRTEPLGPGLAHQVVVAADATARDDHGLAGEREVAGLVPVGRPAPLGGVRSQGPALHADHGAAGDDQPVHPVPELHRDPAGRGVLADPLLERLDHPRPGAPRDVEARHRVAVPGRPAVPPLGPADDREDPVAHLAQPRALLAGREVDVRLGPRPRPVVLLAVELGAAHPVLQRELVGVPDAHPPLLGAVHQEQPAQAPERLAAQALLPLLVEQEHGPARVGRLRSGHQPGEPSSDDDHICVHGRRV